MSKELLFKPGIELKKLIQNKEISPLELTKLSLERIQETEPKVNAFFSVMHDQAILKAKEIENKIIKGEKLGLLGGLPTSVKDVEPVKDVQMTKGSVTTGKTNTSVSNSEFGLATWYKLILLSRIICLISGLLKSKLLLLGLGNLFIFLFYNINWY